MMADEQNPNDKCTAQLPQWQVWLAIFVGVIAAINCVLYAGIGRNKLIFEAGKRLGYAIGSGLGLGLGLSFVLWLLILRRAGRKWSALAFILITAAGTAATIMTYPN
jgi:hypothetical protein